MDSEVWAVFLTKIAIKEGRQENAEGSHVERGRLYPGHLCTLAYHRCHEQITCQALQQQIELGCSKNHSSVQLPSIKWGQQHFLPQRISLVVEASGM